MEKGFEINNSNNIEPTTCARNVRRSRSFERREIRTTRERSMGEVQGGGLSQIFTKPESKHWVCKDNLTSCLCINQLLLNKRTFDTRDIAISP